MLGLRRSGSRRVMGLLVSAEPRGVFGRDSPGGALPREAGRGDPKLYSPLLVEDVRKGSLGWTSRVRASESIFSDARQSSLLCGPRSRRVSPWIRLRARCSSPWRIESSSGPDEPLVVATALLRLPGVNTEVVAAFGVDDFLDLLGGDDMGSSDASGLLMVVSSEVCPRTTSASSSNLIPALPRSAFGL